MTVQTKIYVEFDTHYGLPTAAWLRSSQAPAGLAVDDIGGTFWLNTPNGFVDLGNHPGPVPVFDPGDLLRSLHCSDGPDRWDAW